MRRPALNLAWLLAAAGAAVLPRAAFADAAPIVAPPAHGGTEALAGEDRAAPTSVPTPPGDEGAPVMVSRTEQVAPSFALPALVVRAGGERLDLVRRGDLGVDLDTSGGIKTSPAETGAGQDQRATQAVRATPQGETFTPTPRYGELSAAYGLGDSLTFNGLVAGEQGPWYGWLQGGGHLDDGGPLPSSALEPAQRRDAELGGQGGWRMDPEDLFEGGADGAWRALRLTAFPGDSWQWRSQAGVTADWQGNRLGLTERVQIGAREAQIALPGYAYSETGGGLTVTAQKSLGGDLGSALLQGGLVLGGLDRRDTHSGRTVMKGGAWVEGHVEPWSGGRLGLGARLDWVSGGIAAAQAGPLVDFEQRLLRSLGLRLSFDTGLSLSGLGPTAFKQDPLLPNLDLAPQRQNVDFKAALPWQPLPSLSLEAGAFVRQDESAFLPGLSARPGLWVDSAAGTLQVEGADLDERWQAGPWWQSLQGVAQRPRLSGDLDPTFIPPWTAAAAVGWKRGPWSASTGLKAQGPRQADLLGGWVVPAQWDWWLRAGWDVTADLTVFVEGDSLAGAVTDWPGYTDPSPYLGLGAKLSF